MDNRQKWQELFSSLHGIHQDVNDYAPLFTDEEKVLCRDLVLSAGSAKDVREAWMDYIHAKPGSTFSAFCGTDQAKSLVPDLIDSSRQCPICHEPGGMGPNAIHLHCAVDRRRGEV
jgi:hypothetical protein